MTLRHSTQTKHKCTRAHACVWKRHIIIQQKYNLPVCVCVCARTCVCRCTAVVRFRKKLLLQRLQRLLWLRRCYQNRLCNEAFARRERKNAKLNFEAVKKVKTKLCF